MSDDREIASTAPEDFDDPSSWPDSRTAAAVMMKIFDHFQKHLVVVRTKLGHARTATRQSMEDIQQINQDMGEDQLSDMTRFDHLWDVLIRDFEQAGLTEKELEQVERILSMIPDMIRRYYDVLVAQDQILQDLIAELDAPEYRQAIELTRKIQSRPCRLSGLDPSAFEPAPDHVHSALTHYDVIMYQAPSHIKH